MSKYATVKYPWNKTHNTPESNGIPPHVVIMMDMEELKYVLIKQRQDIVVDFQVELDKRHVVGDTYQANGILEEVTREHGRIMEALGGGISE